MGAREERHADVDVGDGDGLVDGVDGVSRDGTGDDGDTGPGWLIWEASMTLITGRAPGCDPPCLNPATGVRRFDGHSTTGPDSAPPTEDRRRSDGLTHAVLGTRQCRTGWRPYNLLSLNAWTMAVALPHRQRGAQSSGIKIISRIQNMDLMGIP